MGGLNFKKIKKLKFHRLKTWQVFLLLVPLLYLDATLLRFDHLKMVELRDAVLAADIDGEEDTLSAKLEELKNFTFSHIVFNMTESNGTQSLTLGTGVFYLEQQYIRAAADALSEARAQLVDVDDNPNGNVFAQASAVCDPLARANGWAWNSPQFLECMTGELAKYPTADSITDKISANIPSTELYRKNYASPLWAPCPAGFAILATLIVILILFIRFLVWVFLKIALIAMK